MRRPPLAVDRHDREIVVRVVHRVASGAVADLEIEDVLVRLVDQMVRIARVLP